MLFNQVAIDVLKDQYLLKNETPEGMFRRVSHSISSAENTDEDKRKWENIFYTEMNEGRFLPASPFLMNAGRNNMLHSCFVVGKLEDSLKSICEIDTRCAIITQMGGGLGLNISNLREKGAPVGSTGGFSSGAVSFMKKFNTTLDVVYQGRRRGAGIILMSVYHPDIEEFIMVKSNHKEITNFNISVLVDNAFMKAVENDQQIELKSPLGYVTKIVTAKYLFDLITENNLKHAEPGIIFKDNLNKDNPLIETMGEIENVNACGEINMYENEACCLSSIILNSFIENGKLNEEKLKRTTRIVTRFLDNSIDVNNYPDTLIENAHKHTRRLGIGIMGLHNVLQLIGLQYDSPEGRKFAKNIMKIITDTSLDESIQLIKEGRELPSAWYGSTYEKQGIKVRNIAFTSGQPTGSTQVIANKICGSSGIEPIFAVAYKRKVKIDNESFKTHLLIDPVFKKIANDRGFYSDELIDKILNNNGSIQNISEIPDDIKPLFKTATEIHWKEHLLMQAEIQKHTSNALSKTINMSSDTKLEDINQLFMDAWKLGCKGCTIYVQGSRENQPINIENDNNYEYTKVNSTMNVAPCIRFKIPTGCGSMWLFLVYNENGELKEVFSQTSSKGGCNGQTEAVSRLISTALKGNIDPLYIVDQLHSVKCDVSAEASKHNKRIGRSCSDCVGRVIKDFVAGKYNEYMMLSNMITNNPRNNTKQSSNKIQPEKNDRLDNLNDNYTTCPQCGKGIIFKYGGCVQCTECTYSKC